jgi:hypothetical protein
MSPWRHDRDYYARLVILQGKAAIFFFVLTIALMTIWAIESFRGKFWIPCFLSLLAFIMVLNWRKKNKSNAQKAPARL